MESLEDGEGLGSISDIESVVVQDRGSEVSQDETFAPASVPDPPVMATSGLTPSVRTALVWLGEVDSDAVFRQESSGHEDCAEVFCEVRIAEPMRLAMEERFTRTMNDVNGWKLFSLFLRLLLLRPPRGGNIHKGKLAQRFQDFF